MNLIFNFYFDSCLLILLDFKCPLIKQSVLENAKNNAQEAVKIYYLNKKYI